MSHMQEPSFSSIKVKPELITGDKCGPPKMSSFDSKQRSSLCQNSMAGVAQAVTISDMTLKSLSVWSSRLKHLLESPVLSRRHSTKKCAQSKIA